MCNVHPISPLTGNSPNGFNFISFLDFISKSAVWMPFTPSFKAVKGKQTNFSYHFLWVDSNFDHLGLIKPYGRKTVLEEPPLDVYLWNITLDENEIP